MKPALETIVTLAIWAVVVGGLVWGSYELAMHAETVAGKFMRLWWFLASLVVGLIAFYASCGVLAALIED